MGPFERFFGKDRRARAAQRAEDAGDLPRAVELWMDAERPAEAARVLCARSDAELDPKTRLILLGRAIEIAPDGSPAGATARKKRALLRLELAKGGALAAALRHDLREAAADLEALGDVAAAAEAYRLLGDREGHARALVAAGAVEELEEVLHDDVRDERSSRELRDAGARIETLVSTGERRAALAACEALARAHPGDASIREKLDALRSARLVGPMVRLTVERGPSSDYVLGAAVHVGRTEGEILIAHAAVSRTHLRFYRDERGIPHLVDVGSRNGTTLRGVRLGGALAIASETEVMLGGEIPLRAIPEPRALRIEVAGKTYVAPLGPARVGRGDWELVIESDGWVALTRENTPAFFGSLSAGKSTQLLAGDAFAAERGGASILHFER